MGECPEPLIRVDRGIPLPGNINRGRKGRYPWRQMQPGDSFFVPGKSSNTLAACSRHLRSKTGMDFTGRKVVENGVVGTRVWRLR